VLSAKQMGAERIIANGIQLTAEPTPWPSLIDLTAGPLLPPRCRSTRAPLHGVELNGGQLFFSHVHLHGGPAPVRRYLPDLIKRDLDKKIDPGKVFDLKLPLDQVAVGYLAMDERRAIKSLLHP